MHIQSILQMSQLNQKSTPDITLVLRSLSTHLYLIYVE